MKNSSKNGYRPQMERLESRQLMAGDVMVALEGSLLKVNGDNLDNQIAITRNTAGDVVVSGQTGTLVNGMASFRLVRPSINAVEIRMEGGNDVVSLRNLQVANDMFIDLGSGNDRLTTPATTPNTVGANLAIYGSEGNDIVQLNRVTVREDLFVDGGLGTLQASLVDSVIDKTATMVADDLADVITFRNTRVGLDVNIETKGGSDQVNLTDLSAFQLAVNTDANGLVGLDRVTMNRVTTIEDLGVFTGAGADIVRMTDVSSGKSITVSLDEGNDLLVMARVTAAADAVFEGGAGLDTVDFLDVLGSTKREFKEFERVIAR
jgi:large repetitive protein